MAPTGVTDMVTAMAVRHNRSSSHLRPMRVARVHARNQRAFIAVPFNLACMWGFSLGVASLAAGPFGFSFACQGIAHVGLRNL